MSRSTAIYALTLPFPVQCICLVFQTLFGSPTPTPIRRSSQFQAQLSTQQESA